MEPSYDIFSAAKRTTVDVTAMTTTLRAVETQMRDTRVPAFHDARALAVGVFRGISACGFSKSLFEEPEYM
jgi:hypothetical protein